MQARSSDGHRTRSSISKTTACAPNGWDGRAFQSIGPFGLKKKRTSVGLAPSKTCLAVRITLLPFQSQVEPTTTPSDDTLWPDSDLPSVRTPFMTTAVCQATLSEKAWCFSEFSATGFS